MVVAAAAAAAADDTAEAATARWLRKQSMEKQAEREKEREATDLVEVCNVCVCLVSECACVNCVLLYRIEAI